MSTTTYPAWEQELDEWTQKYRPYTNGDNDKFETYGEDLEYVKKQDPRCVWTLVDGDDGNLYIVDGFHYVNRINYLVTSVPFEGSSLEVPYYIYDEEEDE
jgi:hypothetical protein